jgi:small-conductance mechanosensitive channel
LTARRYVAYFVDTKPVETAQQLASLAVTHRERDYAQEALRLSDLLVDLMFASALRDAGEFPAAVTLETRALAVRAKEAEERVTADEDHVTQLTQRVAKARASAKEDLQQELDLAREQFSLDQEELDDAHQDLARAGGDSRATIQHLLDQYQASTLHAAKVQPEISAEASIETTKSNSVLAEGQAWSSLHSKEQLLRQAQKAALERVEKLTVQRDERAKETESETQQSKVIHKELERAPLANNSITNGASTEPASAVSLIRHMAHDQKDLSDLGRSIEEGQELAAVYANWIALVSARERFFLHGIIQSLFWIFLIALAVFAANFWVQRFFGDLTPERRKLHTVRALALLAVQGLGVILILLVIFGMPNNFATLLALAGAGLTVALKDFIVGFFGWFILMGKNGIRPGDWVEINGVGGEVLEVGLIHTVLLETGNWSDAGHPTGRKVTFVNSFAIEGHYFNFSTSGQWLWDEIQVTLPENADPFSTAEAVQKIVTDETAANARRAQHEWEDIRPGHGKTSFSAAPSMSLRPMGSGVDILVRYFTRVDERQQVRARLYRALLELLHKKNTSQPKLSSSSSPSTPDSVSQPQT